MNRVSIGRLTFVAIILALSCVRCGGAIDEHSDESAQAGESVSEQGQALWNGTPLSSENHSGVIALQVWSNGLNSYGTICTGALLSNRVVLTAAHCLWGLENRALYARMGSQRVLVSSRFPSSTVDAALLRLSGNMLMWNWSNTSYLTNPRQLTNSAYRRSLYRSGNSTLNGRTLICVGHGGANWQTGPFEPSAKYGQLTGEYPYGNWRDTHFGQLVVHLAGSAGVEEGDSGGPCFDSWDLVTGRVGVIMTAAANFGVGAGDWVPWADTLLPYL